jgi:hypothetical protein
MKSTGFCFFFVWFCLGREEGINVRSRSGVYEHVVPILMKGKGKGREREPTTASGFCGYEEYFFFSSSSSSSSLLVTLCFRLFSCSGPGAASEVFIGVVVFAAAVVIVAVLLVLSFCLFVCRRPRYPRIGKMSSILASVILIHVRYCMPLYFGLHNPFVKENVRSINIGTLDTSKIYSATFKFNH